MDFGYTAPVLMLHASFFSVPEKEVSNWYGAFIAGAPQALVQSCLTFGAFSFIMEGLNKQHPALALSLSSGNEGENTMKNPMNVLPPFTLPLPPNVMEGFSTFCKSLSKPGTHGTGWIMRHGQNIQYPVLPFFRFCFCVCAD